MHSARLPLLAGSRPPLPYHRRPPSPSLPAYVDCGWFLPLLVFVASPAIPPTEEGARRNGTERRSPRNKVRTTWANKKEKKGEARRESIRRKPQPRGERAETPIDLALPTRGSHPRPLPNPPDGRNPPLRPFLTPRKLPESRPILRPETDGGAEATCSLNQAYACLSSRVHALVRTRARRVGSGDRRSAADWAGERLAPTALSP